MKTLILLIASLVISGCSMFSGNYSEEVAVKDGKVVTSGIFKTPAVNKKRTARSVSIMEQASTAIVGMKDLAPTNKCMTLNFEQLNQLKADAQAAYIQSANMCNMMSVMERTVSQALGRPQSPQEAVARAFVGAVQASEQGMTGRIKAFVNPLAVTIGVKSVAGSFERLGSAKGNTTVGNISTSDSGDTGGEGAFSPNSSTPIIIGDGNTANAAFGSSTAGTNVLTPDNSSSGSLVVDGKTQGQQTAEEINAAAATNDEDGIKF